MDLSIEKPFDVFEDMLACIPIPDVRRQWLRNQYTHASRHYHGLSHVALMWSVHKQAIELQEWRWPATMQSSLFSRLIASFIGYHDCYYNALARKGENEIESRFIWTGHSLEAVAFTDSVGLAIAATADHHGFVYDQEPEAVRAVIAHAISLDLVTFGASWDQFHTNNALVRLEYRHVPDAAWRKANSAFLQDMLAAPVIYPCPVLREHFETQARSNIVRMLEEHARAATVVASSLSLV